MTKINNASSADSTGHQILEFCKKNPGVPQRPRKLAKMLGISESDYPAFREAFKELRRKGKLAPSKRKGDIVIGRYKANAKGFGFITPDEGGAGGEDFYVAAGDSGGALTGDLVRAKKLTIPHPRGGRRRNQAEIIEVIERALQTIVGTLEKIDGAWFLEADGEKLPVPLLITEGLALTPSRSQTRQRSPNQESISGSGLKAVAEIIEYPSGPGMLPLGRLIEVLGEAGQLEVETEAIIRAHELPREFSEAILTDVRGQVKNFDPGRCSKDRLDLTEQIVITIDPADARDFDDALSLDRHDDGSATLGVHIADVSSFIPEGSPLDLEALKRSTSVYFPRRVVHMIPPELSQGLCALAEGERRLTMSVFITYNEEGEVLRRRVASSIIASHKRLTYEEAQTICEGKGDESQPADVVTLVKELEAMARTIQQRRRRAGMLSLDLPEVSLILDDEGNVKDARPAEHLFSHTLIEMFMVEANEAVTALLGGKGVPMIRRIHPAPTPEGSGQLLRFLEACGHPFSRDLEVPSRRQLQKLVESIKGRSEGYAINLAILRSLQQARYSVSDEGHYALASNGYCHFTSPIRRYPDLVVHRLVSRTLLGKQGREVEEEQLSEIAEGSTVKARRAEKAEQELRLIMVLYHLASKVGTTFEGVVTGVADFGLFIQLPHFLVEGLVRRDDLDRGWWSTNDEGDALVDDETGASYRLGDRVRVDLQGVDLLRRHLNLRLLGSRGSEGSRRGQESRRPRRGEKKKEAQHKNRDQPKSHVSGKGRKRGRKKEVPKPSRKGGGKRSGRG